MTLAGGTYKMVIMNVLVKTHFDLVMPYDELYLGQHFPGNGMLSDGTKPIPEQGALWHSPGSKLTRNIHGLNPENVS